MFYIGVLIGTISLLCSVANASMTQQPQQSLEERIRKMSPVQVLQIIESTKTRAFSKDLLIYGGVDENDLKPWRFALQKTRDCALEDAQTSELTREHFNKIQEISTQLIGTIQKWHPQINPLYREKNAQELAAQRDPNKIFDPQPLPTADVSRMANELKLATLQLQVAIHELRTIARHALNQITTPLPAPKAWKEMLYKEGKVKNANTILPNYRKILAQFNEAHDGKKLNRLTEKLNLDKEKVAIVFASNLEKIIFIMEEKEKRDQTTTFRKVKEHFGLSPARARAKRIESAKKLLALIMQRHPDIISDVAIGKLYETKDKPATTRFAQAFNLLCVCQAALKELERCRQQIMHAHNLVDEAPIINPSAQQQAEAIAVQ